MDDGSTERREANCGFGDRQDIRERDDKGESMSDEPNEGEKVSDTDVAPVERQALGIAAPGKPADCRKDAYRRSSRAHQEGIFCPLTRTYNRSRDRKGSSQYPDGPFAPYL